MTSLSACPHCQGSLPPGDEVCPGCGAHVRSEAQTIHPAAPTPTSFPRWEGPTYAPASESRAGGEALPTFPGFEVQGELGRGGMGVVYQARQVKLGRLVALKVMRAGAYADAAERARFQREAETAARLQHPHVVQVYEVGEHDGLPYCAMELCPGGSLAEKLHGGPLPPSEAAGLVETLARAVQAAHDQRLIHRDLKPANVLLSADGQPKVADFGLVRRLDEAGQTASGAIVGTPEYMAPEQAGGNRAEVGPAADTYALGAILYECVTGRPPFKAASALDTLLLVAIDDPVPVRQLQPGTPRDLETICLTCLRKDPGKRYGSALELAEDLRRYRAGEPITARPVSGLERTSKWVRRRPAVAALGGLFLAALVGLAVTAVFLFRANGDARREWQRAQENLVKAQAAEADARAINKFLIDVFLSAPRPEEKGGEVTVHSALDAALPRIAESFPEQPVMEASVRLAIGKTYAQLGLYDQAEPQFRKAVELYEQHCEADYPETLTALCALGEMLSDRGRPTEAEPFCRRALEGRRRTLGPDHLDTLEALNNLAVSLFLQGRLREAEPFFRQNLEALTRVSGPDHPYTLATVNNLAALLDGQGKLEEAEILYRRSLEGRERTLGPSHPGTLTSVNNLAVALANLGRPAEAERLLRQNLEARRRVLGPEHPDTLGTLDDLAWDLLDQGKFAEAQPLLRQALPILRKNQPNDEPRISFCLGGLGRALTDEGKPSEAEPFLREGLEIQKKILGPEHWWLALTRIHLGRCLARLKRFTEAEILLLEGYEGLLKARGAPPLRARQALDMLVELYRDWGKPDQEAEWRRKREAAK